MFGNRIEKIRTAYNWTQVQLAKKLLPLSVNFTHTNGS